MVGATPVFVDVGKILTTSVIKVFLRLLRNVKRKI